MATPAQLTATIAESIGMAEVTVGSYYRALREAGLTTRAGRGRGAPKMTPRDASNMLLATLGAGSVNAAAETVRALRSARLESSKLNDVESDPPPLAAYERLPRDHTLGDLLDAIIEAFMDDGGIICGRSDLPITNMDFAVTRTGFNWLVEFWFDDGNDAGWNVTYFRQRPEFDGLSVDDARPIAIELSTRPAFQRETREKVFMNLFYAVGDRLAGRPFPPTEDDDGE